MSEKRFYLALRGQDKDADVEDALWQLADVLAGNGRIYVEDMRDLEGFVQDARNWWIDGQIQQVRKEREENPLFGFKTLGRYEEDQLKEKFKREYGSLPVYEFTIRKIGFVDDSENQTFCPVEEEKND